MRITIMIADVEVTLESDIPDFVNMDEKEKIIFKLMDRCVADAKKILSEKMMPAK